MGDLIRKSDVLDLLYGIFDKYKMSTDKNTSIGKSFGTDVFEEIRNIPTAYSVDKVVEELEENYFQEGIKNPMCIELDKAIKIVKQGGVSDDVCEWKHSGNVFISCNYKRFTDLHSFEYCPYCSKKIKVVE